MRITRKTAVLCLGLTLPLLAGGCSGGGDAPATPTATPTVVATATPQATPTASLSPTVELTPDAFHSPLGGKPATEAEKEYYARKKEAEDLALARNYTDAIPIFEQLLEQEPGDVEVIFYLMLSHGSTEGAPSKNSKAYPYAEKIVKDHPASREAEKARAYVNSANLSIPDKFKYGTDTMEQRGDWVLAEEPVYKTSGELKFHTGIPARLTPADQAVLWETEASPSTAPVTDLIPKGASVKVLSIKDFLYSLTSWRKPIRPNDVEYDNTIFDVTALYIEVTSEGPLLGKKGWIVHHVDRYLGVSEEDPWGVWISNRLKVDREADLQPPTP